MAWKLGPEAIEIRREQQPFMPAGPQTSDSIKVSQWLILENLLAAAPSWAQPFFYRTQAGAEVDLVLEFDPGSRWAVEIKRSASRPTPSKGFHTACADLEAQRRILVYGGTRAFPQPNGVETLPLARLMEELRAKGRLVDDD